MALDLHFLAFPFVEFLSEAVIGGGSIKKSAQKFHKMHRKTHVGAPLF